MKSAFLKIFGSNRLCLVCNESISGRLSSKKGDVILKYHIVGVYKLSVMKRLMGQCCIIDGCDNVVFYFNMIWPSGKAEP